MARIFRASLLVLTCVLLCVPVLTSSAAAEDPDAVPWQDGGVGKMSDIAEIQLGEELRFADAEGTKIFLRLSENIPSGNEVATIVGPVPGQDEFWFALFQWEPIGYVKDDEKDKIDADAILEQLRKGTEQANDERKKRGWSTVQLLGWKSPPAYDEHSHTLGWAVRTRSEGETGEGVNYFTRLLGRRGVMSVELVASAETYDLALAEFRKALDGYSFQPGQTYAEYRRGDTVAKVGLAALIVGGAGAVAAKSGLLAKFWKVIVAGILALGAGLRSVFSRLFGRKRDGAVEPPPAAGPPPIAP